MNNTFVKKVVLVPLIAFVALSLTVPTAEAGKVENNRRNKNVIVMIPDGCDETVQTVARWHKGEDLQIDKMISGTKKTHMANSIITCSAAAATSFATGHKTTGRFLGVGPRTDDLLTNFAPTADPYAPVASVLEAAKQNGMATGIVATSRVTHATPAAFGVHIEDRGWDNDIMEHLVYNNIDVVFGGGFRHLIPEGTSYLTTFGSTWNGRRTDGDNLYQELLDRGYQFVDNTDDMNALSSGRVWGLFDDSHMQADIDRQYFAEHEPSLAEMVAKAIELLSQNKNGFFLMVEGSQVDWAGHANDPIYMTTDFIAFDDAVKVACDFADKNRNTVVMVYPDHNTGGMKIGHNYTAMHYTATTIEDLVEPLKGMKITSAGLAAMMRGDYSIANIQDKVKEFWSLDITEDEAQDILNYQAAAGVSFDYALSHVISMYYTLIGWTTHGHTGETVPFWVHGGGYKKGVIDNTELAHIAARQMKAKLKNVTKSLYVDLDDVTTDYEIVGDPSIGSYGLLSNLVLNVNGAELPISKDYMEYEGETIRLPGITVYAPATEKVYISKEALSIIGLK